MGYWRRRQSGRLSGGHLHTFGLKLYRSHGSSDRGYTSPCPNHRRHFSFSRWAGYRPSGFGGLQSDNISDSDLSDIRRMEKDVKSQTIGTIGGSTQRSSSWVDECSQYCGTNLSGIKRVCTVVLGEWSLSGNVMDIVGVFQSLPTTTKVPQRRVSVLRTEKPTASST